FERLAAETLRDPAQSALLAEVARELVRRGFRNWVFFVRPDSVPNFGPPITVPFEPTSLNDIDERVIAMLDETPSPDFRSAATQVRASFERKQRTLSSRIARFIAFGTIFLCWSSSVFRSLRGGPFIGRLLNELPMFATLVAVLL